jgi:hypothetical protein
MVRHRRFIGFLFCVGPSSGVDVLRSELFARKRLLERERRLGGKVPRGAAAFGTSQGIANQATTRNERL